MRFNIINSGKKFEDLSEFEIIWSLILFAEKINWSGFLSSIMELRATEIDFNNAEELWIAFVYSDLCGNKISDEDLHKAKNEYANILKKKHKSPKDLLYLRNMRQSISKMKKEIISFQNHLFEKIHIQKLEKYMRRDDSNFIRLFGDGRMSHTYKNIDTDINNTRDSIMLKGETFIFNSLVEEKFSFYDIESDMVTGSQTERVMLRFPIYKVYSPENMEESQISIARENLTKIFKPVSDELDNLKARFLDVDFKREYFREMKEKYFEELKLRLLKFEADLKDNAFIEMLENLESDVKKYELNLCVTSIKNILDYMIEVDQIGEYTRSYICEYLSEEGISENKSIMVFYNKKN